MGFAILAWLVLLYLFSTKPGWLPASSSSSLSASSSQDADEREPRQQIGWRGSLRFAMSKERVRSGVMSGPSPGQRRTAGMRREQTFRSPILRRRTSEVINVSLIPQENRRGAGRHRRSSRLVLDTVNGRSLVSPKLRGIARSSSPPV